MTATRQPTIAVVGGGPAGLMAAEVLRAAGVDVDVDLYDAKASVGRKFLIAGKGGLNLTHNECFADFVQRYRPRHPVEHWLRRFGADALRDWARGLGIETFVGSSGRVFPLDQKAAPLLRGWVRRLRDQGVRFHVQHRCVGIGNGRQLRFVTPDGERTINADAVVFALGGGSWPVLGSDGTWVDWLRKSGADVEILRPSNCGFELDWSEHFIERHAGDPIKPVALGVRENGDWRWQQGELVVSEYGLEGGLIYALSAPLREALGDDGAEIRLDICPTLSVADVERRLAQAPGKRSLSERLRRSLGVTGVRAALIRETPAFDPTASNGALARIIKSLPLRVKSTRPLAEAISSAGGVRFDSVDSGLMLKQCPGVFCAGEMLDWEAPTGGYLLTACFASGVAAAEGVISWLHDAKAKHGDQKRGFIN
ncbi:MAG: TIGR03862 family flavoprotein [Rhodanobacteraceae bacterium]|nr:TIGR03862 family flavoprotein [Xanthomonadales bacterium]MCP5478427.1 TIGR03862 family flavoprotein [Rhodanobacteraceae bacterium]HPF72571.1 TIGR03862 family flavoprotein [Xanthomonadaceae bacterium]HRX99925.1 TIGR03862 family flavoprotein [Xanthomonadaceae bacterium]